MSAELFVSNALEFLNAFIPELTTLTIIVGVIMLLKEVSVMIVEVFRDAHNEMKVYDRKKTVEPVQLPYQSNISLENLLDGELPDEIYKEEKFK